MVFKIATLIVLALFLGVCLLFCNSITIFLTLFAVVMLHFQILQEEKYLTQTFGKPYEEYKETVFRYLGRKRDDNSVDRQKL